MLYNDQGFALPLVLAIMLLLFGSGAFLLGNMALLVREGVEYHDYQYAILLGKNALAECQAAMATDSAYTGTSGRREEKDGASCEIKVQRASEKTRFVTVQTRYKTFRFSYEGAAEYDENGKLIHFSVRLKKVV